MQNILKRENWLVIRGKNDVNDEDRTGKKIKEKESDKKMTEQVWT